MSMVLRDTYIANIHSGDWAAFLNPVFVHSGSMEDDLLAL